jgi:hypothetical protein
MSIGVMPRATNRRTRLRVGAVDDRRNPVTYLTKMQERKRFIAEFARRLREAPPGERVYMRVADVFKDADIYSLDEWRTARWAAVFGDDDGREDTG